MFIRQQESLTPNQVQYLLGFSFSVFTIVGAFSRKLWGVIIWGTIIIIAPVATIFTWTSQLATVFNPHLIWLGWVASYLLNGVGVIVFLIYVIKRSRLWAWNANQWSSLEAFQRSERILSVWGMVILALNVLFYGWLYVFGGFLLVAMLSLH